MKKAKPIRVGVFDIGTEMVVLNLLPGESGGDFRYYPNKNDRPEINVGLDHDRWRECVDVLIHEALEFIMERKELRFERTCKFNADHADYLFIFNHPEFTDACARLALFLTDALPKVATIFKSKRKAKKK